jgi:glucosamine-phosphate N-acetyltransferase
MSEAGLFSSDLLSPTVQEALPDGYRLRALRRSDYDTGFLDCLRVLTSVGEIKREQFVTRFDWLSKQDGSYFILVIEDTNNGGAKVVGTGALVAERKL